MVLNEELVTGFNGMISAGDHPSASEKNPNCGEFRLGD
jgi:hypothetical protein